MGTADGLRINPKIKRLVCSKSGQEVDSHGFERPIGLCFCCPSPGKPVVIEYHLDRIELPTPRRDAGMWTYADLLPVIGPPPFFAADVGLTPIVSVDGWSRELGVERLRQERGHQPVRQLQGPRPFSRRRARPRLRRATILPAHPGQRRRRGEPVLGPARPARLPGLHAARATRTGSTTARPASSAPRFVSTARNIAAAGRKMREDVAAELASGAYVDMSTFFEPGRLEGKKTMGLEIFEHFGADDLPDWILYPTGGGTGLVGIWKAFRGAHRDGAHRP